MSVTKANAYLSTKETAYKNESIFWYDFDEGAGAVLRDKSPRNADLAIEGATWLADGSGWQLIFDGDSDYATLDAPAWPTSGLGALSTIIRVKCAATGAIQWIVNGLQDAATGTYSIVRTEGSTIDYRYSNGSSPVAHVYGTDFFAGKDNEYIFIVITANYTTGEVKFYRNIEGAVKTGTMSTPVTPSGNRPLFLGALDATRYELTGGMRFFAVIPRILSVAEINDLFFLL